jgi:hypothetical protein
VEGAGKGSSQCVGFVRNLDLQIEAALEFADE